MAAKKTTRLTPEQEALLPVIRDKWIALGLSTEPADRPRAERAIRLAYQRAGCVEPTAITWLASPMSGAIGYAFVRELQRRSKAGASVWASVRASVWASVGDSVWASVRDSVGDSVWASVGDSVWASVRASVWDSVGDSVWDSVWASVRASVWDSVGDSVRASVWASVGDSVGDSVRASVGDSVWDSVGASVWASVWDSVGDCVWAAGYGQHDANWIAFYDFFREIGLRAETEKLDGLTEYSASAGWFWPFKGLVILTDRPSELRRDARGRLHASDAAALKYRDGWAIYAWHGLRVAEAIILRPDLITPTQIRDEQNTELRRVLLERYGADRFVRDVGAVPIHADETGTLFRVELADDEPLVMVSLINSTPELDHADGLILAPDGSWRKQYWLRVPPTMRTAREAVAWTFDRKASEYAPEIET